MLDRTKALDKDLCVKGWNYETGWHRRFVYSQGVH